MWIIISTRNNFQLFKFVNLNSMSYLQHGLPLIIEYS